MHIVPCHTLQHASADDLKAALSAARARIWAVQVAEPYSAADECDAVSVLTTAPFTPDRWIQAVGQPDWSAGLLHPIVCSSCAHELTICVYAVPVEHAGARPSHQLYCWACGGADTSISHNPRAILVRFISDIIVDLCLELFGKHLCGDCELCASSRGDANSATETDIAPHVASTEDGHVTSAPTSHAPGAHTPTSPLLISFMQALSIVKQRKLL